MSGNLRYVDISTKRINVYKFVMLHVLLTIHCKIERDKFANNPFYMEKTIYLN